MQRVLLALALAAGVTASIAPQQQKPNSNKTVTASEQRGTDKAPLATERKHLADVDVAEAGGWTGTKAMKLAYQAATPAGVLAAIEASS